MHVADRGVRHNGGSPLDQRVTGRKLMEAAVHFKKAAACNSDGFDSDSTVVEDDVDIQRPSSAVPDENPVLESDSVTAFLGQLKGDERVRPYLYQLSVLEEDGQRILGDCVVAAVTNEASGIRALTAFRDAIFEALWERVRSIEGRLESRDERDEFVAECMDEYNALPTGGFLDENEDISGRAWQDLIKDIDTKSTALSGEARARAVKGSSSEAVLAASRAGDVDGFGAARGGVVDSEPDNDSLSLDEEDDDESIGADAGSGVGDSPSGSGDESVYRENVAYSPADLKSRKRIFRERFATLTPHLINRFLNSQGAVIDLRTTAEEITEKVAASSIKIGAIKDYVSQIAGEIVALREHMDKVKRVGENKVREGVKRSSGDALKVASDREALKRVKFQNLQVFSSAWSILSGTGVTREGLIDQVVERVPSRYIQQFASSEGVRKVARRPSEDVVKTKSVKVEERRRVSLVSSRKVRAFVRRHDCKMSNVDPVDCAVRFIPSDDIQRFLKVAKVNGWIVARHTLIHRLREKQPKVEQLVAKSKGRETKREERERLFVVDTRRLNGFGAMNKCARAACVEDGGALTKKGYVRYLVKYVESEIIKQFCDQMEREGILSKKHKRKLELKRGLAKTHSDPIEKSDSTVKREAKKLLRINEKQLREFGKKNDLPRRCALYFDDYTRLLASRIESKTIKDFLKKAKAGGFVLTEKQLDVRTKKIEKTRSMQASYVEKSEGRKKKEKRALLKLTLKEFQPLARRFGCFCANRVDKTIIVENMVDHIPSDAIQEFLEELDTASSSGGHNAKRQRSR